MKVSDIKEITLLVFDPALFGKSLAFSTMPVSARIIGILSMPTTITYILGTVHHNLSDLIAIIM